MRQWQQQPQQPRPGGSSRRDTASVAIVRWLSSGGLRVGSGCVLCVGGHSGQRFIGCVLRVLQAYLRKSKVTHPCWQLVRCIYTANGPVQLV